ncbi:MAG: DUF3987 domain-containing protein, partial [Tannerella sp.]|nr:DUF3987 domain-containing protein [Tannerella sp.]
MNEVINIEITKKEYPPAGEALNQGGDKGTNNFAQKQEKCAENFDFENPFPLDALPAQMKRDCEELHRCWPAFVPDFQAGAILYAASVVVGNTYRVMSPSGWSTSAALYSAIVGRSGSGKSPVLEYWTKPLEVIDGEKYKLYCDDLAVFNAEVKSGNLSATKPALVNVLLKDATNEALMQALNDAPRGCGLLCEELASWVQNFNRYHKGSDKQAFLSIWSGQNVKVSRKTDGTLLIEKPHLSVIGGVQNELIKSLFDARDGSGFRERLLFFMPRFLKIEYETDAVPDPSIATRWAATIRRLYDVAFDGEPKILSLSAEAREFYRLWNIRFTDERNEPQNYRYGAIFSKMSEYGLRL